jgi:hypothetical protein
MHGAWSYPFGAGTVVIAVTYPPQSSAAVAAFVRAFIELNPPKPA